MKWFVPGENVAEALARRRNCRYGLAGVQMRHVPTGQEFRCQGTVWGKDDSLLIYPDKVRAEDCVLLAPWPVVCCRPSRVKTRKATRS